MQNKRNFLVVESESLIQNYRRVRLTHNSQRVKIGDILSNNIALYVDLLVFEFGMVTLDVLIAGAYSCGVLAYFIAIGWEALGYFRDEPGKFTSIL